MSDLVWSYSMLTCYEDCPLKFYDKYILKNKEPESEALRYGNYVHKSIEDYLNCKRTLPADIPGKTLVENVKSRFASGQAELKMGLRKDLTNTDFFGTGVWGRAAADAILTNGDSLWCGDWKTGKIREKEDQLKILSLFLFRRYPQVKTIKSCNLWLQDNVMGEIYTFKRENEQDMWVDLLKRLDKMYSVVGTEKAAQPNPGFICNYCPVKSCKWNKSKDK